MNQFQTPFRNYSLDNKFSNKHNLRDSNDNLDFKRARSFEIGQLNPNLNSFNQMPSYNNSIKPKGLDNIGATCYMNATLQCFYHCKKLTKYLLGGGYVLDNIKIPKDSITSEYIKLVKELSYKNGKESYAPYDFKEILGQKNPLFKGVAANDSKDLILFLEEELSKDLAIKRNNLSRSLNFVDQTNEMQTFNEAVNEFSRVTSIIKDIFYFMIKTTSICQNCQAKIYNFQVMNFIIFPLEKTYKDSKNTTNSLIMHNLNNLNKSMNYNYNRLNSMNNNFYSMNNNNQWSNYNMNYNMNNMNNMNFNMSMNNMMNMNYNKQGLFNTPQIRLNPFINNSMNMINNMSNSMNNIMNINMNVNSSPNLSDKRAENLRYNSNNNGLIFPTYQNLYNNNLNFNKNNSNFNSNNNFNYGQIEREKNKEINNFRKQAKKPKKNNLANNAENLYFSHKEYNGNNFIGKYHTNSNKLSYQKNDFFNRRNNNNQFNLWGSGGGGPYDNYLYGNQTNTKKGPKITLDQCFESYLLSEFMTGDNKQFCNKCGVLSNSIYSTHIYSSPNILILILNYGKGILFECDVQFDEYINIAKYIDTKTGDVPTRYRLLGAIVHIGPSSMGGHFIAYCRSIENKDKWFKLNDAMVSEASFSDIKKVGIPYVLFYENAQYYK